MIASHLLNRLDCLGISHFKRDKEAQRHLQNMREAKDYSVWKENAFAYDAIVGKEKWKEREDSSLYDSPEIRIRRDVLRGLLEENKVHDLLYSLNEGIHGNMGGMGRPILYNQAKSGTKLLIDDYVSAIVESLKVVANTSDDTIHFDEKLDFFRRASHCYGRSALMLSGGVGLIYFHHGVVQALVDEDILPNVISGSSAGSWVAAQIGTHTDEELKAGYFKNKLYNMPTDTTPLKVLTGLDEYYSPGSIHQQALEEFDSKMTFQDAYEHTGRYINVSIAPAGKHQNSRLMNAITSPNVYIKSAIEASSSIPGIVPPVTLYARSATGKPKPYLPSRKWCDGSMADDLPAKRLARLFGVNHYIVSLINPLAIPFVEDPKLKHSKGFRAITTRLGVDAAKEVLMIAEGILKRTGESFLTPATLLGHAILDQKYTGDINIILGKLDFRWQNVLFQYQSDDIDDLVLTGMRHTWPKIAMIKNTSIIGRTLDSILEELEQRELHYMLSNPKAHVTSSV